MSIIPHNAKNISLIALREGDNSMIIKSIIVTAIIASAATASPALAQSRDHTGSMLPNYYRTNCQQEWGAWGPTPKAAFTATAKPLFDVVALTPGGTANAEVKI